MNPLSPNSEVKTYYNVDNDPTLMDQLHADVIKNADMMRNIDHITQQMEDEENEQDFAGRTITFLNQLTWRSITIGILVILALEAISIWLLFIYETNNDDGKTAIKVIFWPIFIVCSSIILMIFLTFVPIF